ncbi:MAG: GIY-YIG nuclease family protein [Phycisphaerales bacterium]|nr:GIY-YIG nuclease family protein [Hyphomonadaceae bacterium]
MPILFNTLLESAGVSPADTRLLRHQDTRKGAARSVYQLWRDDPGGFEHYQRHQDMTHRSSLASSYWASFVLAPDRALLFVGLYRVIERTPLEATFLNVLTGANDPPGTVDAYTLEPAEQLRDLSGVLAIDWGAGTRAWIQRADNQNKRVLELRKEFKEPEFPGFAALITQLSEVTALPPSWVTALSASRGVYLLTCPETREQYVGAAYGDQGFVGRWMQYAATGHGENVALKSRDPSDYRISILEVAGSAANADDVLAMEARWKAKLQSREMGLNRN